MQEITAENAAEFLRASGRIGSWEAVAVRELAGGVSNQVLLITVPGRGEQFVLKQARGQLRVQAEWLCPIERIWREVETLRICGDLLARCGPNPQPRASGFGSMLAAFAPSVPEILWEDRENYCYAMTAAPEGHRTWKQLLLSGERTTGPGLATACGQLLAALHAGSWADANIAARLDDRLFFDQLRIDPYYRHAARVHADLAAPLQALIDSVWSNRRCLVHGDFSPKNLLVWQGHVMLIDFEVGHYGDPAFDLGFFLTHLALKSIWAGSRREQYTALSAAFWKTYRERLESSVARAEVESLERRTIKNLAGCMLARIDGKSPVDYLDPRQQQRARALARAWLQQPPALMEDVLAILSVDS